MIDPKKIEEWKARLRCPVLIESMWMADGMYLLLAEREEMLGLLTECVSIKREAVARLEAALALPLEVEWGGACENLSDLGGPVDQCPACGRLRAAGDGHVPDCRLAALLEDP